MASFIEVKNGHRAQVRRAGQPTLTKTFTVKDHGTLAGAEKAAKAWAAAQEVAIDSGKIVGVHGKTGLTVAKAIDRYLDENAHLSKTASDILGYVKLGLGKIMLDKIAKSDIIKYIQDKNFGPMSGAMHFSFLRSVLNMAKEVWEYHVPDILPGTAKALAMKKLIGTSVERDRRPTKKEIELLLNYKFPTPIPMADIIKFAISSAMRQSEIMRIEYTTLDTEHIEDSDLNLATIVITDRKHPKKKKGNNQIVPLLNESLEIIQQQKRKEGEDRIFPFSAPTIGTYFTAACKKLGIVDLRFHDLRHEGASRLFELGYEIHEVAKFTGHEDWKMLQRYTHLKSKDIRRLDPKKPEAIKEVAAPAGMDESTMKQFEEFLRFKQMQEMMAAEKAA